jgi:phenylpropionate dioxygenase-like ring-hydroxylating dioxygenase large terminal subunit
MAGDMVYTVLAMLDLGRHFHPVLRSLRLRRGPVRVEVGGVAYALWRDAGGAPRALLDRCPHRHAPLSKGVVRPDGRLACGYHGWHFDGAGDGRSPSVPNLGTCTAQAMQVLEHHGWLWIAHRDVPRTALPDLAGGELQTHWPDEATWRFVGSHAQRAPAPLHVVLDNFSENEHTPYVHGRLGWREEDAARVSVETRCLPDRTEVHYIAPQRPSALLPLVLVRDGDVLHNQWVTRFSPVHSIYTLSWRDPKTDEPRPFSLRVAICFVPETERTTNIVSFMFSRLTAPTRIPRRVMDGLAFAMGWKEVWDDVRWLRHIADTQPGFEGMRLTRFDKPLAHNRKLTEALYLSPPLIDLTAARR